MVKIVGLQKLTLIDFPDKLGAVVFLAGCNFRCGFCHNPEIVVSKPDLEIISEQDFFHFLKIRQGLLEGIVISGGEPLIYQKLPDFLMKIKALGLSLIHI